MRQSNNIDLVYKFLKAKKQAQTFTAIYKHLIQVLKKDNPSLLEPEETKIIARLYSDICLDNRFFLTEKGLWWLCDYASESIVQKDQIQKDSFVTTEEFTREEMLAAKNQQETDIASNDHLVEETLLDDAEQHETNHTQTANQDNTSQQKPELEFDNENYFK